MLTSLALAAQLACAHVMVQRGDTLSEIATTHAKTWRYVWQENPFIKNPNLIYPGEQITICGASLDTVSQTLQTATYPQVTHNQPCQQKIMFPAGAIYMWETPVGCYGGVYYGGFGDCYGWVSHLFHALSETSLHLVAQARAGEFVHIPPGNQGAGPLGHWAYILGIKGQWALISEENMYWRGGGYSKISYRYLLLTPDMLFYK